MEDFLEVIKKAGKVEKRLKTGELKPDIKIAVIGSISTQHFVKVLRYFLYNQGILPDIYEGEYNGIAMDVFQDDSPLYRFQPNFVIILNHYTDIKEYPFILEDAEGVAALSDAVVNYYKKIWERLSCIADCTVLQSNYVIPGERILGNLEDKVPYSKTRFLKSVNDSFEAHKSENMIVVDVEQLACNIGKWQWFDYSAYFLSKSGCRLNYLPDYVACFSDIILNLKGKTKKCLVLDLDNTLWGGVVGDMGYAGIQLDPNSAMGEAYLFFQRYLYELKQKGVILAVCSKNDEWVAKEPFEKNENMVLKLDDFGCFMANWEDKATNLKKIALALNIGVDSLVFFDDNPAEREIVKKFIPEVCVIEVPEDPADYIRVLDSCQPFNWPSITREDLIRANSYAQNANRAKLMEDFVDYNDYLRALEMKGHVGVLKPEDVERFTQLINKSNQFNLRTRRYTEGQIRGFLDDANTRCIGVKLADKFSDYGLISCIILQKEGERAFIDTWVMSCRVLKRGVELFAFSEVVELCRAMGCKEITGEYIRTKKNSMVDGFLASLGFELRSEAADVKCYVYKLDRPSKQNATFIERIGV